MTRKDDTLWEQGLNCVTLLVLATVHTPFIPRGVQTTLTPICLLILLAGLLFDLRKRSGYRDGELEREKRDERNRMIQTQAVWCSYVTEDWLLFGALAISGLLMQNDVVAYTLMYILAARSLLSFGIRWWMDRKY